jgi:hypothetical protein
MIRAWNEFAARFDDWLSMPLAMLSLLLLGGLAGLLWYTFPAWLPHRWWGRFWRALGRAWRRLAAAVGRAPRVLRSARWRGWRPGRLWWRWRRRPTATTDVAEPAADDALPDRPAHEFVSLADWYAAQGRYAEAVRERLRGIVRALVDVQVIAAPPGWTVIELASAAGTALPAVYPCVTGASQVFSDIWYGQRPAAATDDAWMRGYADETARVLAGIPAGVPR